MNSCRLSNSEKTAANLWTKVELADASQVITVPDYLSDNGIHSVDFLKIDIDRKDFDVLNSFDSALDTFEILTLGLEVNFFGSALETDHAFHNTDRFMKAKGFELFSLTIFRYSLAALPGRYLLGFPARTNFGRPLQGDALYARDLGNPDYHELAGRLSATKLLNLPVCSQPSTCRTARPRSRCGFGSGCLPSAMWIGSSTCSPSRCKESRRSG